MVRSLARPPVRSAAPCVVAVWVLAGSWSAAALGADERGRAPAGATTAAADDATDPPPDAAATDAPADEAADDAVALPGDRALERTFDRFARLLTESRWSDAAALCDEILAAPHDVFVRGGPGGAVSLKRETVRRLRAAPRAAREAYGLLFAARAERALGDAIAADDVEAVQAVARRWFDTQAGRDAAVVAALIALESGRAAVASAWLDGLLAAPGTDGLVPTLRAMRDAAVEVGTGGAGPAVAGTDPASPVEWTQLRGDAGRNPVVAASRPLLVPRYRVPLAWAPRDASLLERQRRLFAGGDVPLVPAGTPLLVDRTLLVRASAGILAVDFETGRRLWLEPVADFAREGDAPPPVDDATRMALVGCAGRVVSVENVAADDDDPLGRLQGAGAVANALVARHVADGKPCWRLPREGGANAWHLGPPLVVDDMLHVLVEEGGEVRLDVIDGATGGVRWSQPLATLDDQASLAGPEAAARRSAGLTPALADGVLVCPVGAGAVVALDIATHALAWMARYPTAAARRRDAPLFGGLPFHAPPVVDHRPRLARDGCPVIVGDRVLCAPPDGDGIVCLDLRTGAPVWREPPRGRWLVAGAAGGRVVAIGEKSVAAFDLATGRGLWSLPHASVGGRPSGRGILTEHAILLPVDAPAVVEIALADGSVSGRRQGRRGTIPGNLVACRGAVISCSGDTLDVFHQVAALESLIRAARQNQPDDAWALRWSGQLAIDRGDVAAGLAELRQGLAPRGDDAPGDSHPDTERARDVLDAAILAGMDRDFAAAAAAWRADRGPSVPGGCGDDVARAALDGLLARGDVAGAWDAARHLLESPPAPIGALVRDPADAALAVHPDRWLAARLAEITARAPESLRAEIDAATKAAVAAAPAVSLERLETLASRLGGLPAGSDARGRVVDELASRIAAGADASGLLALRREFHLLALAGAADPDRRAAARAALARPTVDDWAAWPLGAVALERSRAGRAAADPGTRTVPVPVAVADGAVGAGIRVGCDVENGRLVVRDGLGRWLTEPLAPDPAGGQLLADPTWWIQLGAGDAASCIGRLLVVRLDGGATAFDLKPTAGGGRVVWSRRTAGTGLRDAAAGMLVRSVGGRVSRSADLPLGAVIAEADDPTPAGTLRGGRVRHSGVLVHDGTTLALLDPCTGATLWERQPLPRSGQLVGDDDFVCLATPGGRDSLVLAMQDGRVVRRTALPPLRERLGERGRWVVAARPVAPDPGGGVAARVRLELHDAATGETRALGEVPGESRGLVVGEDHLVVLDPDGGLVAFDLDRGTEAFRARLAGLPARPDFLHVMTLPDRLLVVAGSRAGDPEAAPREFDDMPLLQQLEHTGATTPPLWGGIWALDRSTGEPLWPVPVRLDGHCVAMAPPAALPVIVCSRPVRARNDPGGPRLGLVCLDARTGHALVDEEPVSSREPLMGIEVRGDPGAGTILVREVGGPGRSVEARFTGAPAPPRPPYRAAHHPPAPAAEPGPLDRARLRLVPDE